MARVEVMILFRKAEPRAMKPSKENKARGLITRGQHPIDWGGYPPTPLPFPVSWSDSVLKCQSKEVTKTIKIGTK